MADDVKTGALDVVATAAPRDEFRRAISQFTTGVTVVSCHDDGGVHGMTCNSLTSISLDPASVLVSLKPGKTHRLISSQETFGVSILSDSHQALAEDYCGARAGQAQADFVTRHTVPTLRDALAWFECRLIRQVDVYDHTLFVSLVEACGTPKGGPLVFFDGNFHRDAVFGGPDGVVNAIGLQGSAQRLSMYRPEFWEA